MSQISAKSFRSLLVNKYDCDFRITGGYGPNNKVTYPEFKENYSDSLLQAIELIQDKKAVMPEVRLDINIKAHLKKLSKIAEHAKVKDEFVETGRKFKHISYEDVALAIANYLQDIAQNKKAVT